MITRVYGTIVSMNKVSTNKEIVTRGKNNNQSQDNVKVLGREQRVNVHG